METFMLFSIFVIKVLVETNIFHTLKHFNEDSVSLFRLTYSQIQMIQCSQVKLVLFYAAYLLYISDFFKNLYYFFQKTKFNPLIMKRND